MFVLSSRRQDKGYKFFLVCSRTFLNNRCLTEIYNNSVNIYCTLEKNYSTRKKIAKLVEFPRDAPKTGDRAENYKFIEGAAKTRLRANAHK